MHQLPVELLHNVCENLGYHDVRNFRLVNRACAAVGIQYLLPQVFFFFHPDGFERLRENAEHPEFRLHVNSLLYDARYIYQRFADREEWEDNVRRRDHIAAMIADQEAQWEEKMRREAQQVDRDSGIDPEEVLEVSSVVSSDGLEYEFSADRYFRKHPERIIHRTEEELERHYNIYLKTLKQQNDMWKENLDFKTIDYAVKMFPKLKRVRLSTNRFIYSWHRRKDTAFKKAFADTLCKPWSDNRSGIDPPQGVRQLTALLTAVFNANTKVDQVEAGSLSWRFFAQEKSVMQKMMQATRFVTQINLRLDTACDDYGVESDVEGAECREHLSHGSLRRFLQNMPDLTSLEVVFDIDYEPELVMPANLRDIVGYDFKWPKLKEFSVGGIEAKESDLLAFLDDHKGTLRRLGIKTMVLNSGDSWLSMLPEMQRMLRLEEACLCGVLCAREPTAPVDESWDIASDDGEREALTRYLVKGGECPLYLSNMRFRDSMF